LGIFVWAIIPYLGIIVGVIIPDMGNIEDLY